MKSLIFSIGLLVCGFSLNASEEMSKQARVIASYSAAWNSKNLDEMAALMHPDIEWLSVVGSSMKAETKGKEQLVDALKLWFESPALPTGSLRDWSINGNFVAVTETASWLDDAKQAKSQSSLTVYELQDNLIRRVYYYPSLPDK